MLTLCTMFCSCIDARRIINVLMLIVLLQFIDGLMEPGLDSPR